MSGFKKPGKGLPMSSNEVAISVQDLSKCYQIYDAPHDRLKQFVVPRLQSMFGSIPRQYFREFWALNDVSFEVNKGETIGIIGRNGSGKSTLLQIICGTLSPTKGSIETNGRIAALLELGSGFNPEFSGRENVYMNAAVLGLSKSEVDGCYDDIVAFAEIGQFIDQPVKTYSSGMMIRLAFAVAINVNPEILIVDEALSVGDELFQRKCFSRIEAIKKRGVTILFVSHSGRTIIELCDRAVLIDSGEKLASGPPKQIVGRYQKLLYAPANKIEEIRKQICSADEDVEEPVNSVENIAKEMQSTTEQDQILQESFDPGLIPSSTIEYESCGAYIEEPIIQTLTGKRVNNLIRGRNYRYVYKVKFDRSATNVQFGMLIKTVSGVELGGAGSAISPDQKLQYVETGSVYQVEFRFCCMLNSGVYFLNAGVMGDIQESEGFLHRLIDSAMFRILPEDNCYKTGMVDFGCYPEIQLVQGLDSIKIKQRARNNFAN